MAVFHDKNRSKWLVRVRINGHHVQKSFLRKEEASKYERQLLVKKDKIAVQGYNEDVTMGSLMDLYQSVHCPQLKSSKQQGYMLKVFRSSFSGEKAINFNRPRIIVFRDTLLNRAHGGKPISKPTINRYMACLSGIFQVALERGLVPINPVRGIKKFPEPITKTRFLSATEYEVLYGVASSWLKPILAVLVGTGMRISELINLEWSQIDFRQDSITFKKHKADKTTGEKVINMAALATKALESLKTPECAGLVFNHRGKKLSNYGFLRGEIRRATKKAGFTDVSFHTMRHTCASWLVMASGGDMALVKKQLGHSSLSVTERYAKLSAEHQRTGIKAIDNYLEQEKPVSRTVRRMEDYEK